MEDRDFLRSLSSAIRAASLYPKAHPIRAELSEELHRSASTILMNQPTFDLFIFDDSFFFGEKLLVKESLTFQWLLRDWQERGIRSISINRNATTEDLAALVDHLTDAGEAPVGAIAINTAELNLANRNEGDHKLRTAYADALDLMRELNHGMSRGASPSLRSAGQTVEGLVDAVLGDPGSALLLSTLRAHDEYTFFHMVNVCILSVATGAAIGLDRRLLTSLGLGALLHDMGKVSVPSDVLNRTGPLSDDDWTHIRKHPVEGAAVILQSWDRVSPLAASVAYEHHLRMDGTGYPVTRAGTQPNVLARIVSVADTFDALTSRRAYRRAEQRQRALDILLSGAGPHYDPRVVKVFIRMMGFYPPGSIIELSDGTTAVVVRNNPDVLSSPIVKVVRTASGERMEPLEVDLTGAKDLTIVRGLDQQKAGIEPADLA